MPTNEERADRIYVQAAHFELTEALRHAIAEKFRPIMQRNAEIVRLEVRLTQDQNPAACSISPAPRSFRSAGPI